MLDVVAVEAERNAIVTCIFATTRHLNDVMK
jgi:hypothetical protein